MNKILQASYSHYQSRRDFLLSELDILINRSSNIGDTEKAIELFRELAQVVSCINVIEQIINDNKRVEVSDNKLKELDELAVMLEQKLKDSNNTINNE